MTKTKELAVSAAPLSLEQFIEASTGAVMRALEARRPGVGSTGGLPTTTIGIIIRPGDAEGADNPLGARALRQPAPEADDVMATALASAEIHLRFVRGIREQFAANQGERLGVAMQALDRLAAQQLLAPAEAQQFQSLLRDAEKPQANEQALRGRVQQLSDGLRADRASPLALTLAGVVSDASAAPALAPGDTAAPSPRGKKAKACISEGLVGAILGAELGGSGAGVALPLVGAVPGAVVGAVVGGAVGCALGVLASVL